MKIVRQILLPSMALLVVAGAASADPSILAITDAPETYVGTRVTLVGTVTKDSVGYLGESLYTLGADGRTITVLSPAPPPAIGERLEVTGDVALRPADDEFTFPPVLVERSRRPSTP